jgi:site-specific recombinase XerD
MAQKLKRVERNLYLDTDTGIYHVRAMVGGVAKGPFSTYQTTLRMALRKRNEIMARLQERADAEPEVPTLREHWNSYRERKTKASSTWNGQVGRMERRLLPAYGDVRLNAFTKAQIEWYVQRLRKQKLAEGTIAQDIRLLKAVLNDALDNNIIDRNPLRKFGGPKIGVRQRVLTHDEQAKLENVCCPESKRFVLFQLATGIRLDESAKLDPSHINWERHEFKVLGKGSKERWVPVLLQHEGALQAIVKEQLELTGGNRLWTRSGEALRELLYRQCVKANIPKLGPHTLRHTFATRYLEGGGDIYILSKILGHASVRVTEMVYAHVKPRELAALSANVELGVRYGNSA